MRERLQRQAQPTPSSTPSGGVLQRRAADRTEAEPSTVPPVVHDVLGSPGQPLDAADRAFMEPQFGHDFSRVRVHDDAQAGGSARAVGALAYTVGNHVAFAPGRYAPGTEAGRRLLAHELTHVVQQSKGGDLTGTNYRQAESEAGAVSGEVGKGGVVPRVSLAVGHGALQAQAEGGQSWYEAAGEWALGAIGGEFIDEPTFGQIAADFVLSVIPVVDQVADARDLSAHVYRLGIRGEHNKWERWVGLVFTLLGLIPEVGSVIKSLSRAALRGVGSILENIGEILRMARRLIPVDVSDVGRLRRYVMDNWSRFVKFGTDAWNRLLARGDELVSMVPRIAGGARQAALARLATLRRFSSERLLPAFEHAWNVILDALDRAREKLGLGRRAPTPELPSAAPTPREPKSGPAAPPHGAPEPLAPHGVPEPVPPQGVPEPVPLRRAPDESEPIPPHRVSEQDPGRGIPILKTVQYEEMMEYLRQVWRDYPILARVARAQTLTGDAQRRELVDILKEFAEKTRIPVDKVPNGQVQALTGVSGNYGSLRAVLGRLQIEEQAFDNPAKLMEEVRHELAFHYTGGPWSMTAIGRSTNNYAHQLLDSMIKRGGPLPPRPR